MKSSTSPSSKTVHAVLLDTETSGLVHGQDELIGLAVLAVELDRTDGRLLRRIGAYEGLREPLGGLSDEAVAIIGRNMSFFRGKALDEVRITELLDGCEVVISHNAAFDRPFVEAAISAFGALTWVCSLSDIDWRGAERQASASLEHLFRLHGLRSDATPGDEVDALASLLACDLPASPRTGFAQLLRRVDEIRRSGGDQST